MLFAVVVAVGVLVCRCIDVTSRARELDPTLDATRFLDRFKIKIETKAQSDDLSFSWAKFALRLPAAGSTMNETAQ